MFRHIDPRTCRELSVESDQYPLVIDRRSRGFGLDFGPVLAVKQVRDIVRSHGLTTRLPAPGLVEVHGIFISVVDLRAGVGMSHTSRTIESRVAIAGSIGTPLAMVLHDDNRRNQQDLSLATALSEPAEDRVGDFLKVVVRDGRMVVLLDVPQSEPALAQSVLENVCAVVRTTVVLAKMSNK